MIRIPKKKILKDIDLKEFKKDLNFSELFWVNTPIRGLSTIFKKIALDLIYLVDVWDTQKKRTLTFCGKPKPRIGVHFAWFGPISQILI